MREWSGGHARVAVEVTGGEAGTLFNLTQRDFKLDQLYRISVRSATELSRKV